MVSRAKFGDVAKRSGERDRANTECFNVCEFRAWEGPRERNGEELERPRRESDKNVMLLRRAIEF